MTVNRQDYIKAIYELGGEKNKIGTKELARAIKVSPPSVSEMIKKLVKEGYIEYISYQGVRLTEHGLHEALEIKKRHLLWEVFLVQKLGYDWEDAHEEAEILEHVTSSKLKERLERYLDYPETCPHGTPIDKVSCIFNYVSLDQMDLGNNAVITRLRDEKDILRYVRLIDLKIGDSIKVLEKNKDGSIKIKKGTRDIEIVQELAKKFIFGQASTVLLRDVKIIAILGIILLLLVALFWKEFKLVSFDIEFAAKSLLFHVFKHEGHEDENFKAREKGIYR